MLSDGNVARKARYWPNDGSVQSPKIANPVGPQNSSSNQEQDVPEELELMNLALRSKPAQLAAPTFASAGRAKFILVQIAMITGPQLPNFGSDFLDARVRAPQQFVKESLSFVG